MKLVFQWESEKGTVRSLTLHGACNMRILKTVFMLVNVKLQKA